MAYSEQKENSLKDMIKSCFTYGGAERGSHNFKRYIEPFRNDIGNDLFDVIYVNHLTYLKNTFEIKHNVYTDHEGCSYNQLIPK